MRGWLIAAGLYNLVWGAVMVVAPVWTLRALGVSPQGEELWPQLWACIGMIVGVYGVGYLVASRDPARHWPIVLVGLLGKVLGPVGFLDAAIRGDLPWSMGVTILTNDLLWWAPFSMILWHAARSAHPPPSGEVSLDAAIDALRDEQGRTLRSLSEDSPTLVVLLRHTGCTFCRQTLSQLAQQQSRTDQAGLRLAIVGMSPDAADLRAFGERYGVAAAAWFADPDRLLYRALQLGRGSFLQLFGPRVWWRGLRAAMQGHGVGRLEGDGFQMPGAFVIHRGRVIRRHVHTHAGDRPDYQELACPTT